MRTSGCFVRDTDVIGGGVRTAVRPALFCGWYIRFGHFTGYGASYYAYLYAKMFTSAIWER